MKQTAAFLKLLFLSKTSLLGAALVTSCVIADLLLISGEIFIFESHPYIGIFTYLLLPGLAVLGLLLIPLGIILRIRRQGQGFSGAAIGRLVESSRVDPMHVLEIVFGLSLLNLVIFSFIGYRGFHYTESKEFCGQLCHEVMDPEYTAYSRSPHSEVACVECHIGSGAGWFVKSKLSGLRQVLAVARNSFSRPIETPIHNLRPARDVCEVCHRPEKFHGDVIKTIQHFEPDEKNTRTYTVLNMVVGSGGEHGAKAQGIHWHVSRGHQLRYYASDTKRESVAWIEVKQADGTRKVWRRPGFETPDEQLDPNALRLMDCVDCHNRPTHVFLPLERALDDTLAAGRVDPSIPWIRKVAEEVLAPAYASRESAMAAVAGLPAIYQERYPAAWQEHRAKIEAAVPSLQEVHRTFVHPNMGVQWDTYPSLLGHPTRATAGCFRCHDGVLKDERGHGITLECNACHFVLANRQTSPPILKILANQ